jgi:hypothetical protein
VVGDEFLKDRLDRRKVEADAAEMGMSWILNLWVAMSFRRAVRLPMLPNKSREESHGMV